MNPLVSTWIRAAVLPVLLCLLAGCAQEGPAGSGGAGSGSVTMYGTMDEGVSVTHR
jgi:hypothetical protein